MKITRPQTREVQTCELCGGIGWTDTTTTDHLGNKLRASKPCRCLIQKVVLSRLGVLRTVRMPKAPCLDSMTDQTLHLVGPWDVIGPQIKHAVIKRSWGLNPSWTCSVISDVDIRAAFFADKPNFAKAKDPVSFSDLMEVPDLLVVRPGMLATRNKDAPSMFLDALRSRSGPIWLVDDTAEPVSKCQVHSERLDTLLESWMRVDLGEEDR